MVESSFSPSSPQKSGYANTNAYQSPPMKKPVQRENEECHSPSRTNNAMHSPLKKATNKPYGTRIEIIPGKFTYISACLGCLTLILFHDYSLLLSINLRSFQNYQKNTVFA